MKAYGIPRTSDIESPDVADIKAYGLASRVGRLDGHSYFRSYSAKRRTRRIWKRRARVANKASCAE